VAMLFAGLGIFLIGFSSSSYTLMVLFLFIYSMGNHLFMPVSTTVGMELATEGRTGRRLGQLNAIRNAATVVGSFIVFIGFKYLHFQYQTSFTIASIAFLLAALLMFLMQPNGRLHHAPFSNCARNTRCIMRFPFSPAPANRSSSLSPLG
jgi:MFS family permease